MTTIIQNFTLVSLISTVTPHPVKLPLGAVVPSLSMHSSPYALVFLRTCFPSHSSPYVLNFLWWRGKIAKKDDEEGPAPVWDCPLVKVCSLSSSIVTVSDEEVEAVGWMQSTLLPCVVVSFVIGINQSNWLDDKRSPSVCCQFDNEGPPLVCHRVFREAGSMTKVWQIPTFSMSLG